MLQRIATGVILAVIVVTAIWISPPIVIAGLAAVVAILALVEFFDLGDRVGLRGYKKWTYVCTLLIFYSQYCVGNLQTRTFNGGISFIHDAKGGFLALDAALLLFLFGCVAIGLASRRPLHETFPAMAVSCAGILLVAFPFSYVVRLNETETTGKQLVLFTLALVWAGDVLAYFVGKSLGRVKMAPLLSPKKTWEGALGNVFASMITAVFFARWMQIDVITLVLIAAAANIAGQAGDLIESAYKRGADVKDSGHILPGHGGMLDRIDSLILAAPVAWILYQFLGHPH
jgi:phosphatidate cytidylyltransferase